MHSMNCRSIYGGGNECEMNIGFSQIIVLIDRCQGFWN